MSFIDRAISWIATGGKSEEWQAQTDENDIHIANNWERIIADPRTSPTDRLAAERELAAQKALIQTPPRVWDDSGEIFANEVVEQAKKLPGNIGLSIGKLLPWYVWGIIILALLAYLVPFFLSRRK